MYIWYRQQTHFLTVYYEDLGTINHIHFLNRHIGLNVYKCNQNIPNFQKYEGRI